MSYRNHVGPPNSYLRPSRRHIGVVRRPSKPTWSIWGHFGCVYSRPVFSRCCLSLELFASTRLWTESPSRCSRFGNSVCILEKRQYLNRLRSNLVLPRGVSTCDPVCVKIDMYPRRCRPELNRIALYSSTERRDGLCSSAPLLFGTVC